MKTIWINGERHFVIREQITQRSHVRLFTSRDGEQAEAQHTLPLKWWKAPPQGGITTGGCFYEKPSTRDDGSGHF